MKNPFITIFNNNNEVRTIPIDTSINKREEILSEIRGYKLLLNQSDYKALKYAEGSISYADYAETKQYREDLRAKINLCEEKLANLPEEEI